MVLKSIITAVLCTISWSLYVFYYPENNAYQTFYQKNIAKAESLMYGSEEIETILVGSSLSNHIQKEKIPDVFNLSFAGMGSYDGLFLMKKINKYPRYILIESNYLLNKIIKKNFHENLFTAYQYYSRKHFAFLRIDKQPIAHLSYYFLIHKNKMFFSKIGFQNRGKALSLKKLIKVQRNIFNKKITEKEINEKIKILKEELSHFTEKGSKIIFYEMPVNPELLNTPLAINTRKKIAEICRSKQYDLIPLPDDHLTYITTDGVHLNKKEGDRYSDYFANELIKRGIIKQKKSN